jgi:hypothetical protein
MIFLQNLSINLTNPKEGSKVKKLLAIGLIFSAHNIYAAENAENHDMCKTHKSLNETHKSHIREDGEIIYYPNKYQNYSEYREAQYITNLLFKRLEILSHFGRLHSLWLSNEMPKAEYLTLKFNLERNDMMLIHDCKRDVLKIIFGEEYDYNCIKINHMLNIATVLKERIESDDQNQLELDNIIEKIENIISYHGNEEIIYTIGKESFLNAK